MSAFHILSSWPHHNAIVIQRLWPCAEVALTQQIFPKATSVRANTQLKHTADYLLAVYLSDDSQPKYTFSAVIEGKGEIINSKSCGWVFNWHQMLHLFLLILLPRQQNAAGFIGLSLHQEELMQQLNVKNVVCKFWAEVAFSKFSL